MKKQHNIYTSTTGFHISAKKVQVYGEYLYEVLAEKHDGTLTPGIVVEDAKNPDSPLHEVFDWNNKSAAHKYRLVTARNLVRSIEVEIIDMPPVVFFANVKLTGGDRVYKRIYEVMSDAELRQQVLEEALEYFERGRTRWESLKELSEIFRAIDSVKSKAA